MRKLFYQLYLQQFAEDGTDGESSGGETTSQDAAETTGEETGQDAADEQEQETKKATFDELLKANPDYKEAYDKAAQELANMFVKNFSKYTNMPEAIINAGPKAK